MRYEVERRREEGGGRPLCEGEVPNGTVPNGTQCHLMKKMCQTEPSPMSPFLYFCSVYGEREFVSDVV